MRILVLSDSHGRSSEIQKAIEAQPDARHVFFLGDVLSDIEDMEYFYPDRIFHSVRGNCDFYSDAPLRGSISVGGTNIFFCHGHEYGVKGGTATLLSYARARGADIVLFGHTHVAHTEYCDGIHLVNPGSLSRGREGGCSYAVIDIESGGVMPIIVRV